MEIVSRVRKTLGDKVGNERFDLWFGDQVSFEYSNDTLWVRAPDSFTLDRLRTKLRAEIDAAVRAVVGTESSIRFTIRDAQARLDFPASNTVAADGLTTGLPGAASSERFADHAGGPSSGSTSDPGAADSASLPVSTGSKPALRSSPRTAGRGRGSSPRLRQTTLPFPAAEAPVRLKRAAATLEDFIVGDSNRVAFAGARSVLSRLGLVSPLFLFGPPGCGKSHLGEAILSAVRARGCRRAVGLSSEQFTSLFLEALHESGLPSFRRKYRDVELLVIDDVQFLAGKKATLVEFQHTLDMLQRQGSQVVLTADRSPADLSGLGQELVARMSSGLVCSMQMPEYETRLGIVRQLATRRQVVMGDQVAEMIATELLGDARQISGALHRLQATSEALRLPIGTEMAAQCLADLFRSTRRIVRLSDIQRAVCDVFGLDVKTLQTGGKARTVSHPRMLAMWLARKYTRAALSEIGQFFGRRSHTSVLAAQRKVDQLVASQSTIRLDQHACSVEDALRRIEQQLRTG
ncbi:MAG: Chromosomal replication initiator protein DnaA [Planctomycetota bacterium]